MAIRVNTGGRAKVMLIQALETGKGVEGVALHAVIKMLTYLGDALNFVAANSRVELYSRDRVLRTD